MIKTIRKQLMQLPYGDLFGFAKENGVINGFDYEVVDDMCVIVLTDKNGTVSKYKPSDRQYDFIVNEAISRLSAVPHILRFANERYKPTQKVVWPKRKVSIIPGEMDDPFDFALAGIQEIDGELGMAMYSIEVKCRENDKYTKEYFNKNGVMVDLQKQTKATTLYTQSSDGYGFFFNMEDAVRTGQTITDKTTVGKTGEKVLKDRIYFNVSDAIAVYEPYESKVIADYINENNAS